MSALDREVLAEKLLAFLARVYDSLPATPRVDDAPTT